MMNNSQENKFKIIEDSDIIVGIDIAKNTHWAVITATNGKILMKSFYFNNTTKGFECLVENIEKVLKMIKGKKAIVGMEPTGNYWKALAKYLKNKENIKVVTVNPYHVKKVFKKILSKTSYIILKQKCHFHFIFINRTKECKD